MCTAAWGVNAGYFCYTCDRACCMCFTMAATIISATQTFSARPCRCDQDCSMTLSCVTVPVNSFHSRDSSTVSFRSQKLSREWLTERHFSADKAFQCHTAFVLSVYSSAVKVVCSVQTQLVCLVQVLRAATACSDRLCDQLHWCVCVCVCVYVCDDDDDETLSG